MPPLDYAKLKQRFEELDERAELLRSWQSISRDDFLTDPKTNRAVLRVLQEAIEGCLSVANHLVSAMAYGQPETYADAFRLLADHGVLDETFEVELERMVGFRNRIIHRYWEIDWNEVYQVFTERVDDFERFKVEILRFIKSLGVDDDAEPAS